MKIHHRLLYVLSGKLVKLDNFGILLVGRRQYSQGGFFILSFYH